MQVKLLRLLESGTFRRVGGLETKNSDFRLVAATHKPLQKMVDEGKFRADLFYRICAFPIELPALRNRKDDIPKLVHSLLRRGSGALGIQYVVSEKAMHALMGFSWPGNIRQLKNVLDRARVFADDGRIELEHLPEELLRPSQAYETVEAGTSRPKSKKLTVDELREIENNFNGSRRELAEFLGMSERTLYRKLGSDREMG